MTCANRGGSWLMTGTTAPPSGTASAPFGQKSFCTSTTRRTPLSVGDAAWIDGVVDCWFIGAPPSLLFFHPRQSIVLFEDLPDLIVRQRGRRVAIAAGHRFRGDER